MPLKTISPLIVPPASGRRFEIAVAFIAIVEEFVEMFEVLVVIFVAFVEIKEVLEAISVVFVPTCESVVFKLPLRSPAAIVPS